MLDVIIQTMNLGPEGAPLDNARLIPMSERCSGMVYGFSGRPDTAVRFTDEFGYGQDERSQKYLAFEGLKRAGKLFAELQGKYGIETVGFRPVVARFGSQNIGGMIVSDKINGEFHEEGAELPANRRPAAQRLLSRLSRYIVDKHRTQEPFLSDIASLEQYLYMPEKDEFVLVDIDPYIDTSANWERLFFEHTEEWAKHTLDGYEFADWQQDMRASLELDRG